MADGNAGQPRWTHSRRVTQDILQLSSCYTDDAIAHHGVLDSGTHFLAKPFAATDLTTKVREVLDEPVPMLY